MTTSLITPTASLALAAQGVPTFAQIPVPAPTRSTLAAPWPQGIGLQQQDIAPGNDLAEPVPALFVPGPARADFRAPRTIFEQLMSTEMQREMALALPRTLSAERITRAALAVIRASPRLQACAVETLRAAVLRACEMGIEPDGRGGQLVPRWLDRTGGWEAEFVANDRGIIALVRRDAAGRGETRFSPRGETRLAPRGGRRRLRRIVTAAPGRGLRDLEAEVVCAADFFQVTKGLHPDLRHEITTRSPRGALVGAYALARYRDGRVEFVWMPRAEVEAHQARHSSPAGHIHVEIEPGTATEAARARKTVLLRLLAGLDLDAETVDRLSRDPEFAPALAKENTTPPAQTSRDAAQPAIEAPAAQSGASSGTNYASIAQGEAPATHGEASTAQRPASAPARPHTPAALTASAMHAELRRMRAATADEKILGIAAQEETPVDSEGAGARSPRARWSWAGPSTPAARRTTQPSMAIRSDSAAAVPGEPWSPEAAAEALPFAAELRAAYPEHEDPALLAVFQRLHLASPTARRLEEVAPRVLQQALEDPESFASALLPATSTDDTTNLDDANANAANATPAVTSLEISAS